jgi:ClpP class serine protease
MIYVALLAASAGAASTYALMRKRTRKAKFENVLELVDEVDETKSILSQVVSADTTFLNNIQHIRERLNDIPDTDVLNVILSTPGGVLFNCSRLLRLLRRRKHGYRVFIRKYAMSAGTLLALGAKEIVMMADDSFLGKIDPAEGRDSRMVHVLRAEQSALQSKHKFSFNDHLAIARARDMENELEDILRCLELNPTLLLDVRQHLINSKYPHEHKFDLEFCRVVGLNVREPTKAEEKYFE